MIEQIFVFFWKIYFTIWTQTNHNIKSNQSRFYDNLLTVFMNEKKELRKLVFLLIFLNNIGIFSKLLWPFVEEYLLVLTNSDFELIPILWKYLLKLESANKGFCMFDLGNRFCVWFITEEGNWFQTIRRNNSNTVFWHCLIGPGLF